MVIMRRTLFIILVVCALSAMTAIPKRRRAINPDEEENKASSSTSATTIICAPQTPCGWSVYHSPNNKIIKLNITNSYCTCAEGTKCIKSEGDKDDDSAFVLKCKKPES